MKSNAAVLLFITCLVAYAELPYKLPPKAKYTASSEAINTANASPGGDLIQFNIPTTDPGYNGQWWTITLTMGDLPTLFDSGTTV